jgi:hypothetical protein
MRKSKKQEANSSELKHDGWIVINILEQHDIVDLIAPAAMDFTIPDCCSFGPAEWVRTWYVREWPRVVGYAHWRSLLHFPGEVRISQFMLPLRPALVAKQLEQQATAIQASRFVRFFQKRDASPAEDHDYQQIMEERSRVEIAGEPFYYLTTTLGLIARSKAELDRWSEDLERLCQDAGIVIDRALWQQPEGLLSLLPLNLNTLGNHQRNARLDTLANMFPFVADEIVMPNGMFYGFNTSTGTSVVLDPFALENPNTVIVGIPGGGKSYFMKDLIEQYVLSGARAHVIDVEEEYKWLCEDLGGCYLDMGIKSEHKINVLDPDPDDEEGLAGAFQSFRGWMGSVLERPMAPQEVDALDTAYFDCFAKRGMVKEDNNTLRKPPEAMPRLSDLYRHLLGKDAPAALTLASAIKPMAIGGESEAFNCTTNVDVYTNPLIVFGLKDVSDAMKPRRIRQVQQFTWNQMLKGLSRTIEVVDEAWHLLQHDETARDLAERARRFRKKNGALFIATQHLDDFASNRHAATLLSLAATHLLFLQQATSLDGIAQLFKLQPNEVRHLASLEAGHFLMRTNRLKMLMFKPVPEARHKLYTTRPDEVAAFQAQRAQRES